VQLWCFVHSFPGFSALAPRRRRDGIMIC
jgi:hypothetical protein